MTCVFLHESKPEVLNIIDLSSRCAMEAKQEGRFSSPAVVLVVYLAWMLITALIPQLNRVFDFNAVNPYILPGLRMLLLFLVTALFIRFSERKPVTYGFNLNLQRLGRNVFYAVVFFLVTTVVVWAYQRFVVVPLTHAEVTASSQELPEALGPFAERLTSYLYVLFEGMVEVLTFIGFMLDRLARKWGWAWALLLSNLGFALWHYDYLRAGWLQGSLMMALTFLAGITISFSYLKTRNSLSPMICHTLVDAPSELGALLGLRIMF